MKEDQQKLLHLKNKISNIPSEDKRNLALLGKEVFYVITKNLDLHPSRDYPKEDSSFMDLIDWLQCLNQINNTTAIQLKRDILFSIELSLYALSNGNRN